MQTILTIEDEEDILTLIRYNLIKSGFNVIEAGSGEDGLKKLHRKIPDLILLDIMLPGMDGIEFCKAIRHDKKGKNIPIIMLTAKGEEADIVKGLESGADDYIKKPFSPKVLIARINAVLRRKKDIAVKDDEIIEIENLLIHPGRHEVNLGNESVILSKTEFDILHFLARRPGWVFTRYQIVDGVKGENYLVTDRAIDVTIVSLRKKLGKYADLIETVRGVGYRFKDKNNG